jgi:hypothetical protein
VVDITSEFIQLRWSEIRAAELLSDHFADGVLSCFQRQSTILYIFARENAAFASGLIGLIQWLDESFHYVVTGYFDVADLRSSSQVALCRTMDFLQASVNGSLPHVRTNMALREVLVVHEPRIFASGNGFVDDWFGTTTSKR